MNLIRETVCARSLRDTVLKRLWVAVIGLMLALQIGVLVHESQHHLRGDVVAQDDCALCQVAGSMSAPPAPPVLSAPVMVLVAITVTAPTRVLRAARAILPFRSRAPPASVRI